MILILANNVNYKKHYDNLIERARNRTIDDSVYCELHHIVPKCMGGSDHPENLVKLYASEHFVAHELLVKIYPKNKPLIFGVLCMTRGHRRMNNKLFAWHRKKLSEANRQGQLNRKPWKHKKETKEKIRNSLLGVSHSAERKSNVSKSLTGRKNPAARELMLGKKLSKETRDKMSRYNSGLKWITNGIEQKRHNPENEIPTGWYFGMKRTTKGTY